MLVMKRRGVMKGGGTPPHPHGIKARMLTGEAGGVETMGGRLLGRVAATPRAHLLKREVVWALFLSTSGPRA